MKTVVANKTFVTVRICGQMRRKEETDVIRGIQKMSSRFFELDLKIQRGVLKSWFQLLADPDTPNRVVSVLVSAICSVPGTLLPGHLPRLVETWNFSISSLVYTLMSKAREPYASLLFALYVDMEERKDQNLWSLLKCEPCLSSLDRLRRKASKKSVRILAGRLFKKVSDTVQRYAQ